MPPRRKTAGGEGPSPEGEALPAPADPAAAAAQAAGRAVAPGSPQPGPSLAPAAGEPARTVTPSGAPAPVGATPAAPAATVPAPGAVAGEAADGPAPAGSGEGLNFEAMLEELEAIVARLEAGDEPLDRALELFQRGIGLVRQCNRFLDAMERKIQWLLEDESGAIQTLPAPELNPAAGEGDRR